MPIFELKSLIERYLDKTTEQTKLNLPPCEFGSSPTDDIYSKSPWRSFFFANRRQYFWGFVFTLFLLMSGTLSTSKSETVLNMSTFVFCCLRLTKMRFLLNSLRNSACRRFVPFSSVGTCSKWLNRMMILVFVSHGFFSRNLMHFFTLVVSLSAHLTNSYFRDFILSPVNMLLYSKYVLENLETPQLNLCLLICSFSLFILDWFLSMKHRYSELSIISTQHEPSCHQVLRIEFEKPERPFKYKAGDYFLVQFPDINEDSYHPSSVTSSPDEETLTCHILGVGPWSRQVIECADRLAGVNCEGPFTGVGRGVFDKSTDVAILFGYSICATPFLSLLKHFHRTKQSRCKKVYFVLISNEWSHWMIDALDSFKNDTRIENHIFYPKVDFESKILIGSRSETCCKHLGWPRLDDILSHVVSQHRHEAINVFTSAPPRLIFAMNEAIGSKRNLKVKSYYEAF